MDSSAVWQQRIWSFERDLQRGVKENWFRCRGRTSQVRQRHVELSSNRNSRWWWTNQRHTRPWVHSPCVVRGAEEVLIFPGWEITQMRIPPLLLFLFRRGGKKVPPSVGLLFQDTFKEETVGGCWHCRVVVALPKCGANIHPGPVVSFLLNPLWTSNSFLGRRSQKFKLSLRIILDAKNTN